MVARWYFRLLAILICCLFSAGPAQAVTVTSAAANPNPVVVGAGVTFSATVSNPDGSPLSFSWNLGDGTRTPWVSTSTVTHTYTQRGRYLVILLVTDGGSPVTATFTLTVHDPLPAVGPTSSGTILYDNARNRVWSVNPDHDSVTCVDATANTKLFEAVVGDHPRTLAQAPDGSIWIANQGSATLSVLNPTTGALLATIALPRASRPYAVAFDPARAAAYVTLEGTGKLLKLSPSTRTITGTLDVGPTPRGIAISPDSRRVLVTRWISPTDHGVVTEVRTDTFAIARQFALAMDPALDTEVNGRGVPNALTSITISPDGAQAWVPSKKDNVVRGLVRDGNPLSFENTVRTIASQIDLAANQETLAKRIDFNDGSMASAVKFSRLGDLAFIALEGTNVIAVRDAVTNSALTVLETGLAPQGLALSPDGNRVYTQDFMSRTISVYDIRGILSGSDFAEKKLATIKAVAVETLSAQVLKGKQIFYNANDRRMSRDGYISCVACHMDGGSDERVWDFTNLGEGFRNTTTLLGRRGTGHGRVHWSANFDEIQDFEHAIRDGFSGLGFMTDAAFNTGTRNTPLGTPKAGVSADLDALAAYVSSLAEIPASPERAADSTLTTDARAGKALFGQLDCASCHSGRDFTDSAAGILHDVGTLKASSGKRLGQLLTGIDTPSLRGIWNTAPYLHDGSAATLMDVITTANPTGRHGGMTAALTLAQRQQLVAYLRQIDSTEMFVSISSPAAGATLTAPATLTITANASDRDGTITKVDFFNGGALLGSDATSPYAFTWSNVAVGSYSLTAKATDNAGAIAISSAVGVTVKAAVVVPNAPTITTQPTSRSVTAGQTATFSVAASGTAPLAYQWQKNNANISGATSASYTTPATAITDNGATFRVLISNSAGSVTSAGATLTVSGSTATLRPDVILTALSYANGTFNCTVKNQGNGPTPAGAAIGVGFSVDNTWRTAGFAGAPLAAGASAGVVSNPGYVIPNGTHTILAWVDDANRFSESNEANNQLTQTITVASPANGTGLTGHYFDNSNFTGANFSRTDATVNFDWGLSSPHAFIGADTFSARWTGQVQPQYSQTYTFHVTGDDGVRLWVNGSLLIDKWIVQAATEHSAPIALTAGVKYDIKLEYYENLGSAAAQLRWSSLNTPKAIIPASRLYPGVPPASTSLIFTASADFSGAQGFRNWSYLDSNGTPLLYDSAASMWKGTEAWLWLWANGCHPGTGRDIVRRWTVPQSGTISITGIVRDADPNGGDGIIAIIRKNGAELWKTTIANGNAAGASFSLPQTVVVGDRIDFVVNRLGSNSNDSTAFDPTITLTTMAIPLGSG
jgi:DNA-binding beta-propeller fold protein YncE